MKLVLIWSACGWLILAPSSLVETVPDLLREQCSSLFHELLCDPLFTSCLRPSCPVPGPYVRPWTGPRGIRILASVG
ncbi:hypothetical protein CC79DRAFT_1334044 [Sarocladium strictum]